MIRTLGRNKKQPTGGLVTPDAGVENNIANDDHIHPFWEAWNDFSFTAPWAHVAGAQPSRFCKTAELVYLQLLTNNVTANQQYIGTLPEGFRPRIVTYTVCRALIAGVGTTCLLFIDPLGRVGAQDLALAAIQQSTGIRVNVFFRLDNG